MEYRLLGDTRLKIGAIGVGCMTFGWRADAEEASAIIAAALDVGINLFDTSVSSGRRGESLRQAERYPDCNEVWRTSDSRRHARGNRQ
jgi:aryl-alcohol dehydrogenase-like predicted oxidoreductase